VNREEYRTFTLELMRGLASRDDVLGLVAVGSMAERDYLPDQWSDHDFWLIVEPGVQDRYRDHQDWLPSAEGIAWAFRETAHGVKALYRNGHLLEYAVFDEEEMNLAKTNRYRVLLDRAGIESRMIQIERETRAWAVDTCDAFHLGQFLTNLLVGVGRYQRGEVLSAHQFVKAKAVQHLLVLLSRHVPSKRQATADNIDPARRFELVYPKLGQELGALLLCEVPEAAKGLLTLFEKEVGREAIDVPEEVFNVLLAQLEVLADPM